MSARDTPNDTEYIKQKLKNIRALKKQGRHKLAQIEANDLLDYLGL